MNKFDAVLNMSKLKWKYDEDDSIYHTEDEKYQIEYLNKKGVEDEVQNLRKKINKNM